MSTRGLALLFCLLSVASLRAEQFRTNVAGVLDLRSAPEASLDLGFNDSLLLRVPGKGRFVRGVELLIHAPQAYLRNKGSLAIVFYRAGSIQATAGIVDVSTERLFIEALPGRLKNVYQIPLRADHGFKTGPYAALPFPYAGAGDYLVRIMPIIKGFEEGIETWRFGATARLVYADEGAVRLRIRYPAGLEGQSYTLSVDDRVVNLVDGELVLKSGDHQLAVRGEAFRTEHRLLSIVAGQVQDLEVLLRDPAPIVFIQVPEDVKVWFDDEELDTALLGAVDAAGPTASAPTNTPEGLVTTAGEHELVFKIGNYTLRRSLTTRLGMTYEVNFLVDVQVEERD